MREVGREDASDEGDEHEGVLAVVAQGVEVPPGIAAGRDGRVEAGACVRIAQGLFETLAEARLLCVGAGEMVSLVASQFASCGVHELAVANRGAERAVELARRVSGRAIEWSQLPQQLAGFDIVVSCTASTLPIIGLGAVKRALAARRRRPMLLIDLAVPRDIEGEVGRLDDAYLYTLDDLATVVAEGTECRRDAAAQAEGIVEQGVADFERWLAGRSTVPLIRAVQGQVEGWRMHEVERARRRLRAGATPDAVLEALSLALAGKMMHGAWLELRACDAARRPSVERTVSSLFLANGRGRVRDREEG